MSPLWQLLVHTASLNSFTATLSPKDFLFCLSLNDVDPLGFPESSGVWPASGSPMLEGEVHVGSAAVEEMKGGLCCAPFLPLVK